ncbi:HAD-IA family hydrolase [Parahaliea sp. F7430]|uniref:HAD-IA family hydrolase n=1 Tax=Sediminihaliea albiluteola TaxID=2758564 RepID=A0A7W2TVT4_9GAMM|nr:HAD-IA family hydrolase [Sediminihaliea albiluteola]MBA6412869.1 HAD-IA family hydrolase [Sediminihaliea albiluteola]
MSTQAQNLQAVLFDLDGTLIDTASEFVIVVQALREEHGLAPTDEKLIRASVSNGARALVKLALDIDEQAPEFESKRLRLLELYSDVLGSSATPYPGITELLGALDERGIRWGISTNKPRAYTIPLLERLALSPSAGSVVCPDDVSERKPHPESLYLNCKHLGCEPTQAIYIGDHRRDIEAGRRAGMKTIAALYGYIEADDDPSSWGADHAVHSSRDLQGLIL